MNIEMIAKALGDWPPPFEEDGHILVPTHCLYPSNSVVTVWVGSALGSFIVHDNRCAIDEVSAAGVGDLHSLLYSTFMVKRIVAGYGLSIDATGLIKATDVSEGDIIATISLVANASKEAALDLINRYKLRMRRNIKLDLAHLLEIKFPNNVQKNGIIIGKSNKPHKFDSVVRLGGTRQLALDAVVNEASSINAALVSHLDVRNAENTDIEQRIVYDDNENWSAADLNLLRLGATPVPFSRVQEVLERLAA